MHVGQSCPLSLDSVASAVHRNEPSPFHVSCATIRFCELSCGIRAQPIDRGNINLIETSQMTVVSSSTGVAHPKPWEEKSRWIAGLLAILIPGAGHFYQGRILKGLIYSFSILGLFAWGQKLGEGTVVYNLPDKGGIFRHVALSYAAQLATGAVAMPALIQNKRAEQSTNQKLTRIAGPLTAEFQGRLVPLDQPNRGTLIGTVTVHPKEGDYGPEMEGTFSGSLDGERIEIPLGGRFELDKPIKAGFRRQIECGVVEPSALAGKMIEGSIPRSLFNAYGSPPDVDQLQELNGRLGKLYELALVFTWIAGLLNILAFWDCICGPAYGFGDEHLNPLGNDDSKTPPATGESQRRVASDAETSRAEPRAALKSPA